MNLNKSHLNHPSYSFYNTGSDYRFPSDGHVWKTCPRCYLTPKVKITDGLRRTACGCWKASGDRWQVAAESKDSYYYRKRTHKGFDEDNLRKNWNEYCSTGKLNFPLGDTTLKWKFRTLFAKKKRWG